ncbi:hypothetical protein B0H17DRAFT_1133553 [Mycena rosella]|uniref:Uncharacterized protein n=1 Tax=Mycena rosella TaxID=1033263 RepID=A0AAD7GK57_MYCRO|nr:hypothetical protein B0H17DRAFT_1133553 [Mycena rosella]
MRYRWESSMYSGLLLLRALLFGLRPLLTVRDQLLHLFRHERSMLFNRRDEWKPTLLRVDQRNGSICDPKVPCCPTGAINNGPLYCGTTKRCTGCIQTNAFIDPLVPCCSGKSNSNFCIA